MSNTLRRSGRKAAMVATLGTAILMQLPLAASAGAATTSTGARCTITGTSKADTLRGTSGKDVICGLGGNDKITGLGGDDIIDAGSGSDTVYAGPGNDTLIGGTGSDTLHGDSGTDTVSYADHNNSVRADLDGTRNDGSTSENDLIGTSVENLIGGAGSDTLTGSSGVNVLVGGNGNDQIRGGAAKDTLNGGSGSDICDVEASETAVSCSADSTAPHIATWAMNWAADNAGTRTVVATAGGVTDNFSGVARVEMRLVGPNANWVHATSLVDGTYGTEFVLPAEAAAGAYELFVTAFDGKENRREVTADTTIGQAAAADGDPYVATWNLAANKPAGKTGPMTVIATANVVDDSAVDSVALRLVGPGGVLYGGTAALVEGDDRDGTYKLVFVVPADAPAGTYRLRVDATDDGDNAVSFLTTSTVANA